VSLRRPVFNVQETPSMGLAEAGLATNFREYTPKIKTKPVLPRYVDVFLESLTYSKGISSQN